MDRITTWLMIALFAVGVAVTGCENGEDEAWDEYQEERQEAREEYREEISDAREEALEERADELEEAAEDVD